MSEKIGINFKFPLRKSNKGFFETNKTTLSSIREDIKTLLLTKRGERLIHCNLGTNISIFDGILYENQNKDEIKAKLVNEINRALKEWMPFISLTNLDVVTYLEDSKLSRNTILIKMEYLVNDASGLRDSITLRVSSTENT